MTVPKASFWYKLGYVTAGYRRLPFLNSWVPSRSCWHLQPQFAPCFPASLVILKSLHLRVHHLPSTNTPAHGFPWLHLACLSPFRFCLPISDPAHVGVSAVSPDSCTFYFSRWLHLTHACCFLICPCNKTEFIGQAGTLIYPWIPTKCRTISKTRVFSLWTAFFSSPTPTFGGRCRNGVLR